MKAFRHTGIVIFDLDKELHFYRDLLGLRIVKDEVETGPYIDAVLDTKGTRVRTIKMEADTGGLLELLWFGSHLTKREDQSAPYDPGLSHIAFTVSDLNSVYNRLRVKGVCFNSEPMLSTGGFAKVAFCRDPEGNLVELVEEITKK
ncbi:MAG: VOC family protein [Candidatus Omnitrophota bacterium]